MIASTNAVAKIAAVVAGLGLVAMSFAVAVPAKAASVDELQAQINALLAQIASLQGGSSSSVTFTMDLTIGSTGSEVTALQNFLMSHGQSIPAGATGYFGTQTQAALAAWQAANGVSPAAGYFGPITRAKVNSMGGGSTGSTGSTGDLSGGEADFRNFDLIGGDDISEGDEGVEIAIAKFEVRGGDAEIQRVTVDFQPDVSSATANEHPWQYIDRLAVEVDGDEIGDVDAGRKSDWDQNDDDAAHTDATALDYYSIDIPVSYVAREGDTVELSILADAQGTIDSDDLDQNFIIQVPTDGVRAVDSEGIQQYTGDGEEVTVGFDAAENGDLTVKKSSDNPVAGTLVADDTTTSDEFDVLAFEIKNSDASDALLTDLTVTVATTTASGSSASDLTDIIRRATLTVDGDDFDGDVQTDNTIDFNDLDVSLPGDDTVDFTLSVQLYGQSGHFAATGEALTFSVVGSTGVTAEGESTGDASTVSGTATGEQQSIAVDGGITVEGSTMSTADHNNDTTPASSFGTFTMKIDVTAVGDDVYIPKTAADGTTVASTTYTGIVAKSDLLGSTTSSTVTTSLTTTADSDNSLFYVVHAGDTETFTVSLTLDPTGTNDFQAGIDKVRFSTTDSNLNSLQTIDVDQTDNDFHTDPLHIVNS